MAQRRMFSKKIVETDFFMEMSPTAKLLYFYLNMSADDDGFVGNPKTIKLISGATDDDLKILITKQFIIPFDSGVIVIKDWKIHNYIQKDRYNQTQYLDEKNQLVVEENGTYTKCIQDVSSLDTQVRLGKSKDRLGKDSIDASQPNAFQEKSSGEDINSLLSEYLDSFIEFSSINIAKRAMAQVEFMKLSSEEKKQAVIGAKNYFEWYKQENPEDKTKKFSINSYAFLESATFKSFQQKVKVKKETLGGLI